ncbi:MAG: ATP-dependent DNA helicase [Vibrio sp.]
MIKTAFSAQGALSKAIDGFKARDAQIEMAEAVDACIQNQDQLVVEAGTGTGKTYAYLVPALLRGEKTMISTGSKTLQEQLFHRDLPLMVKALGFHGHVALLKGRSNYLCIERLERQIAESHHHASDPKLLTQLVKVRAWSSSSKTGDLGDCDDLPEDSPALPLVTSTNDNCLGKECPNFQDCYVLKARKKALEADVVVVNHHLFFADLAMKDTGFGELIPEAKVFIFDEAHQLPDIASHYFGQSVSSRQFKSVVRDILLGYRTGAADMRQLEKAAQKLENAYLDLTIALGAPGFRGNWREAMTNPNIVASIARLQDALEFARAVLKLALGRSEILDSAFERLHQLDNHLKRVCDTSISGYSYWFEASQYHFALHITPLSIQDKFQQHLSQIDGSWIFTSATLAVQDDFSHFTKRLGLKPSQTMTLASPFDYQTQASLCVPRDLPEPNHPHRAKALVKALAPIIEQNQGRCFFLCTSHQMMRQVSEGLRDALDLPILMQGETSKQKLLAQYIQMGNAVLVATGAFWEGVDVRGDTLSCVIIDKLPFTAPDDPLLKARIEDCRLTGGEPFSDVQLPDAVITLKQGVGRLIRDTQDRGALIICDNRLVTRDYGAMFLQSLPDIPRTRSLQKIADFLAPNAGML